MNPTVQALTGFFPQLLPEAVLSAVACVLFLGGTWRPGRGLWAVVGLVGLALAGAALAWTSVAVPTVDATRQHVADLRAKIEDPKTPSSEKPGLEKSRDEADAALHATVYAAPVQNSHLALLVKAIALAGAAVLLLFGWKEVAAEHAAEYHACLLLMTAGVCLTGASNDLITLFLSLELISIPTYVLLYLPRSDKQAQEAAMKYFLLSIFSSALLLFGFSYLYGAAGTTNLPAILEALTQTGAGPGTAGLALTAVVMVTAALGFRIAAAPFHFYAPDVYEGTSTGAAALLAFVPKVAGFVALIRVLGYAPVFDPQGAGGLTLDGQTPKLLWIMAAVTMSLGNVLALLQNNLKRLLAYSSVAHAGWMLVGLAAAPKLGDAAAVSGVEAVLFYLVAYGAMTTGAFAVISYLSTPEKPVETVDDLAGLSGTRPGAALALVLFLFSLIGMPLTAGFLGKLLLFIAAMGVPSDPKAGAWMQSSVLFTILAFIGVINAAIGAWYYLRIAAVMYLRPPLQPPERSRAWPVLAAVWVCALVTLAVGLYPQPLAQAVAAAVRGPAPAVAPATPRGVAAAEKEP